MWLQKQLRTQLQFKPFFRRVTQISQARFIIMSTTATVKTPIPINTNFKLTETEKKITDLLNEYTKYYNDNIAAANPAELKPLTLRITGGWVRDKLLGKESHDIDIGIDHLSGLDFVTGLKDYVDAKAGVEAEDSKSIKGGENKEIGEQKSDKQPRAVSRSMYKIEKNPEKSKHLETCTTKIYNVDIDFVNLRSEKYTEDSRIPTIEKGTPEEDALRRDATLNAMFFNLSTMQVEDLTGKGLSDLQNGILRTPLEPINTFLDDPLRCLRLIRFAACYSFNVDPVTLQAMKQEQIREMLKHKISRERIDFQLW
ncbi:unnamed protein product [Ambrosiozyma monospora]|uniref:Unnamed protein product n=1 Tax=Ambrosiozyma monospora TaxID=43982 RepID=A0ACB5TAH3_AMBMO|nr:unnamed protein product [Ambrosiozyma monospora]